MQKLQNITVMLKKAPYSKDISVHTLDSITKSSLFSLLVDIFTKIDEKEYSQLDHQNMSIQMLNRLKIYGFKVPNDVDKIEIFLSKLVNVDRELIYNIMEWLLTNSDSLRKRAFLSNFLCDVNIPHDLINDPDIIVLNQEHMNLIEEFKSLHMATENIPSENDIKYLKSDIIQMRSEKSKILKRIEFLLSKIHTFPNRDTLFEKVASFRKEKKKEIQLKKEVDDLQILLETLKQEHDSSETELRVVRAKRFNKGPLDLLRELRVEVDVRRKEAEDKFPDEITNLKEYLEDVTKLMSEEELTKEQFEMIRNEAYDLQTKISRIREKINSDLTSGSIKIEEELLQQKLEELQIIQKEKQTCLEKIKADYEHEVSVGMDYENGDFDAKGLVNMMKERLETTEANLKKLKEQELTEQDIISHVKAMIMENQELPDVEFKKTNETIDLLRKKVTEKEEKLQSLEKDIYNRRKDLDVKSDLLLELEEQVLKLTEELNRLENYNETMKMAKSNQDSLCKELERKKEHEIRLTEKIALLKGKKEHEIQDKMFADLIKLFTLKLESAKELIEQDKNHKISENHMIL